jgi:hypothetical protein
MSEHGTLMGEMRKAYKNLVGKAEGKKLREKNIMYLKEMGVRKCGLDLTGSKWIPIVGSHGHSYK